MNIKRLISILCLVLMVVLFLAGCSSNNKTNQSTDVQIATVKKGTIVNQITPTGNLQMTTQAKLTFGASGTVDQILVNIGDSVKTGQVLAKLDAVTLSSLQQSLLQAQIDVKTAQMNLDNVRTPTLSNTGATVSAPDPLNIEAKELALQRAKLNLDNAQRQLDGSIIFAPFDGLVAVINVLVGDRVTMSTVIMRIIDPSKLEVETLVNEMDIFNIKLGSAATIQVVALPSVSLPATVTAISPAATISGGVVNYTVELQVTSASSIRPSVSSGVASGRPATSDNQTSTAGNRIAQAGETAQRQALAMPTLKEGLSVNITIVIQQKENVLLIPSRALIREGRNTFTQVQKADKSTEKRAVKAGISDWQNTEITEGLNEGENIVITKTTTNPTTTNQPGGFGGMPRVNIR